MKKIVSFVMAAALVMGIGQSAFAQTPGTGAAATQEQKLKVHHFNCAVCSQPEEEMTLTVVNFDGRFYAPIDELGDSSLGTNAYYEVDGTRSFGFENRVLAVFGPNGAHFSVKADELTNRITGDSYMQKGYLPLRTFFELLGYTVELKGKTLNVYHPYYHDKDGVLHLF